MKRYRLIVTAIVALIGLSFAVGQETKPADVSPELSWIPGDSVAFLHVRFGDLWNSPAGKSMRDAVTRDDQDAMGRIERALGVRLNQVERLTLLIPAAIGDAPDDSILVRVTTREPYDRTAVLELLGVKKSPLPNSAFLQNSGGVVRFSDPTNLTFAYSRRHGPELLARLERSTKPGRLAPALKLAAEKHLLVAAIDVAPARQLAWVSADAALRPFHIARSAVLIGDLKPNGVELSLRISSGLRVHAEQVAEALAARLTEGLKTLADALKVIARAKEPGRAGMLDGLLAGLKGAKVEQKERDVVAAMTLPSADALGVMAVEAIDHVQSNHDKMVSANNLKWLALAMHNYQSANNHLPNPALKSKDGKPLLSWRVAILPYIEEDALYRQFRMDEPWDSEHNKKLLAKMPKMYQLPGHTRKYDIASTHYRVFVGNGAVFDHKKKATIEGISDGPSLTILIAEATDAVPWTKPEDIEYDPKKPPPIGFHFAGRANAAFADGSMRTLRRSISERTLHLLIQANDGNPVEIPDR